MCSDRYCEERGVYPRCWSAPTQILTAFDGIHHLLTCRRLLTFSFVCTIDWQLVRVEVTMLLKFSPSDGEFFAVRHGLYLTYSIIMLR